MIRPPTIRRPRSRSARRSSPTSAASPAQDFFKGLFETALEAGELITQVSFPIPQKAAYMKFANPASRYALVGVFVAKTAGGVRVAVTGAGANGVFRANALEAALNAEFLAGRARRRLRAGKRPQFGPPRRRRLSRPPHRGDGEARGGGGGLRARIVAPGRSGRGRA